MVMVVVCEIIAYCSSHTYNLHRNWQANKMMMNNSLKREINDFCAESNVKKLVNPLDKQHNMKIFVKRPPTDK